MNEYKRDENAQQTTDTASVFRSINLMSVGVAALLSTGMIVDKHSVTVSVLSGVGFYGAIAGLLILWQPGALPSVIINRQNQITIRRRDELPYRAQLMAHSQGQRVSLVDPLQIGREESALPTANFVPAVPQADPRLKLSCVEFVTALFNDDGSPNPRRILAAHTRRPGQIQYSKPKPEVLDYLISMGMVTEGNGGMLFFNTDLCPTLQEAVNAIRRGYTAGRGGYLPLTPPFEGGEVMP